MAHVGHVVHKGSQDDWEFEYWQGKEVFPFSKTSRPDLGAHPASCSKRTVVLSSGVKQPVREVVLLFQSSAEVKNQWSHHSTQYMPL
jgi:hypothetical protein